MRKDVAGLYIAWISLFIVSSAADGMFMAAGRESMLNSLIGGQIANVQGAGALAIIYMISGFTTAILSMITWDFPMYSSGVGLFFKIVVLYPISLGVIIFIVGFLAQVAQSKLGAVAIAGGLIAAGASSLIAFVT